MTKEVIIKVIKPGMYTTVQDAGRPDFRAQAVPVSGPMDKRSAYQANWLVGNPTDAPVLEMTMIGPQLEITGEAQIAVTGANLQPMLDGEPMLAYNTVHLTGVSQLRFKHSPFACRSYLAINGLWQIPTWLGSKSAMPYVGQLFNPASQITKGQKWSVSYEHEDDVLVRFIAKDEQLFYPQELKVAVVPGPDFDVLNETQQQFFFSNSFQVENDSNRMAIRLAPSIPGYTSAFELLSSGVMPGLIQITHSGQPMILHRDAQTTGGYPRFAKVIDRDLDLLGQAKPADIVQFVFEDLPEFAARR